MQLLGKAVQIAYEMAFLLAFLVLLLLPFHSFSTHHYPIVETLSGTEALIRGEVQRLEVGDELPLYRFHSGWKAPIGTARVTNVDENEARVVTVQNQWPLGRHATVVRDGEEYFASMGSDLGITEGQYLTIFRDNYVVGQARVARVEAERSLLEVPRDVGPLDGLVVSEFGIATQAVHYKSLLVSALEVGAIALTILGYLWFLIAKKRSPFLAFGEYLRLLRVPRRALFWTVNLAAGIPFAWFMGSIPFYLLSYFVSELSLRFSGNPVFLRPLFDPYIPFVIFLIAAIYGGYLVWKQRSPILDLWHWISYKGTGVVKEVSWKRGLVNWALHLVIVYFFGLIMLQFLSGNIAAMQSIGTPSSAEEFFEWAKFALWTVTVLGVILGYGYSVVSILWGRFIRSVDFTVTGWLTNGFCYPLFGVAIWQMTPSFTGAEPILSAGPLLGLVLFLGLFFNLLYTLSILNLGTMFSLMSDKGVRTSLFYNTTRHPNYALETGMFFATELVGLASGMNWIGMLMIFFLYWIRSEREDNFMQYSNPAYAPYQQKVPWKFIPGIY